jgi:hypothetical protein
LPAMISARDLRLMGVFGMFMVVWSDLHTKILDHTATMSTVFRRRLS